MRKRSSTFQAPLDLISFRIPSDLIESHALWWYGADIDFVLNEEVSQWLADHDMKPEVKIKHLRHREPCGDDSEIQYEIVFESLYEATLFKLRWF